MDVKCDADAEFNFEDEQPLISSSRRFLGGGSLSWRFRVPTALLGLHSLA